MLENIEPKAVFNFFEKMCAIPHGSGNTKAISDFLADFAKERGLEYYQDSLNNVIIVREASAGCERAPALILQGHMDMVCEKTADCKKDMDKEGIDLAVDGDLIYAEGTTLGGDDGIGVAMGLAALDDENLKHPRLECIFTVDEETGMEGAAGIDLSMLKGRKMINLDSEDEGNFCVSCAGGAKAKCALKINRDVYSGSVMSVKISGLIGGHSGQEINKGRGNASVLMGRFLCELKNETDYRIISISGGLKDNAIPVSAEAAISVSDKDAVFKTVKKLGSDLAFEYSVTDPKISLKAEECRSDLLPFDKLSTEKTAAMLACLPNGVQEMSPFIDGLVQTSLNLGILKTDSDTVSAVFCVRSNIESQKYALLDRLKCFMDIIGGYVSLSGNYPGWAYLENSPLRDVLVEEFEKQYGKKPVIEAIHAGVECGLFSGKLPGLDCVSIGPQLSEIHTPRENMSISSVERTWKFLVSCIEALAEK